MQYSQKVLDHFMRPHNVGQMENPDAVATEGSPSCGDQVTIYLKINPDTLVIEDVSFLSYHNAGSTSAATRHVHFKNDKGEVMRSTHGNTATAMKNRALKNEIMGMLKAKMAQKMNIEGK